jgi:chemotaxis-related protein WspB
MADCPVKSAQTLFLLFHLGKNSYVLEACCIEEVLPFIEMERVSSASTTAGIVNYRGNALPVIDLSQLFWNQPTLARLSTRIIVVRSSGQSRSLVGLMAERVTTMLRRAKEDFVESGFEGINAELGPVLLDETGLIQWVKPESISAIHAGRAHLSGKAQ